MSRDEGVARIESVAARFPDAVRLARVASLAVRIEPHLVRQLRLRLVRDADVGAEADLWFSMLVESRGVDAIVLHRDVAAILRDELSGHPRFDEIVSILVEAHRGAPSTIALEEKVNALAVRDGAAAGDQIDRELRAAILAMRESDARAREIARWFLRAFPRLHPVVQCCSNAIGLRLSASMLLGRRGASDVAETKGSLATVGWMLPQGALDARIEMGVERLSDALRFVALEQTAIAAPTAGGSTGRLSIPRSEPRLVEVAWSHDGTREQRVVEALPGTTVMLGAGATDVRVVTLAGDEYELVASAATRVETPPVESTVDLEQYGRILRSCVPVQTTSDPRATGMAVRVNGEYLFTARQPFGRDRELMVLLRGGEVPCPVVAMPDYSDLIAVEWTSAAPEPAPFATAPFTARQTEEQNALERVPEDAVVIGFDGTSMRGVKGTAEIDDFSGNEFRVLVPDAQPWVSGLAGGPVVIGERVRGIVNAVHVPRMGDTAILSVIGASRIHDLLQRVISQRAPTLEPPEPPPWVVDVCLEIRAPGVSNAIGLVVSDRLIVSTATALRVAESVSVVTRNAPVAARVLDYGNDGPLVFLAVASEDRFRTQATLIRTTTRVRRPNDPADPPDAMLVTVRDGLRTIAVPDASSAGVVKSRDPDGYRFEVEVRGISGDRAAELRHAILVWGDAVAGIALPPERSQRASSQRPLSRGSSQPAPRMRVEFLSVNVIKESINDALARLERLEREPPFRAWLSTVPVDLEDHFENALRRTQQHGGLTSRLDVADGFVGAQARQEAEALAANNDLFVLLVGDRRVTMKGVEESVAQFEYGLALRAGIDILVFLSQDESRITDRQMLAWRAELKSRHRVQYFASLEEFGTRLEAALTQWREARVRRDPEQRQERSQQAPPVAADVPPQQSEPRVAASGRHLAKVVMYGQPHSGKTALLRDLTQSDFDPVTRRRGMIWVDGPRTAPDLHAGIVVYEARTDENWPLALDLEDASLALVAVPFDSGQESATNALVTRVRSIAPGMPIVTVLTRRDREDAAASVLQRLSSEIASDAPVIQGAIDSSGGPEPIVAELIKQISWGDRTALGDREWDEARVDRRRVFGTTMSDPPVVRRRPSHPPTMSRLRRLAGERELGGEYILHGPLTFENIAVAIVSHSRSIINGLPAVQLREVSVPNLSQPSDIRPADLIDAVAEELASKRVGALSSKTGHSIFVLTSLLETTFEPTVPAEAQPLLRANWTGAGRDVFIEVLVYYAYTASKTVDAAWQPPLLRGTARISHDSELYVEVIETGELAELKLSASARGRGGSNGEIARQLREALESILAGNASLSFEMLSGWSG
jgi:hypothetical protein